MTTPPHPTAPSCRPDAPDAPAFDAPWQARAFAMAVALHDRGLFAWPEWSDRLGAAIAAAPPDDGAGYWDRWVETLEAVMRERGVAP